MKKRAEGERAKELAKYIRIHVRASGPVSFESINAYLEQQAPDYTKDENWVAARALTHLIRSGEMELYDDGKSFVATY